MNEGQEKRNAGVWIDHRKAVIAILTAEGQETIELNSNVEKQAGRVEGLRSTAPYEAQLVQADDIRERIFTSQLDHFYARVSEAIRGIESVLVFGPGEAKGEFKKHFERAKIGGRILAIDTTDALTNGQIVAKVRAFFLDHG